MPSKVDRKMRKLLAKNERKRKNREARVVKAANLTLDQSLTGDSYAVRI